VGWAARGKEGKDWAAREKERAQMAGWFSLDFPKRKTSRGKRVLEGFWRKRKTHKNMCWTQDNISDFIKLV
jgi:hypothetical protein